MMFLLRSSNWLLSWIGRSITTVADTREEVTSATRTTTRTAFMGESLVNIFPLQSQAAPADVKFAYNKVDQR